MTNIEIKAHYPDVERAEENLNALGAGLAGTFHQKDTYFNMDQGRLKLRELGVDEGHLIFYQREDLAGPKRSDYEIAKTEDPEGLLWEFYKYNGDADFLRPPTRDTAPAAVETTAEKSAECCP